MIPFDKKTRILNPEVIIKAGTPYGKITGLQIFNEMINVDQLAQYSGKFDFLGKEIDWKDGYVKVNYKQNIVTLSEGKLATSDYALTFGGTVNVASMNLNMNTEMALAKKNSDKVKAKISNLLDKLITGKAKSFVKADQVADTAMKPMLNEKGEVYLKYAIKGTASKPDVVLVQPKLGSLSDLVKNSLKDIAGNLTDQVKDAAKDKAKEKANEQINKSAGKALKKLKLF